MPHAELWVWWYTCNASRQSPATIFSLNYRVHIDYRPIFLPAYLFAPMTELFVHTTRAPVGQLMRRKETLFQINQLLAPLVPALAILPSTIRWVSRYLSIAVDVALSHLVMYCRRLGSRYPFITATRRSHPRTRSVATVRVSPLSAVRSPPAAPRAPPRSSGATRVPALPRPPIVDVSNDAAVSERISSSSRATDARTSLLEANVLGPSPFRPHVPADRRVLLWTAPYSAHAHSALQEQQVPLNLQARIFETLLGTHVAEIRESYGAVLLRFAQFCNRLGVDESARMPAPRFLLAAAAYNLISACTACQGLDSAVQNWAAYDQSCNAFSRDTYFPARLASQRGRQFHFGLARILETSRGNPRYGNAWVS
ncbi:hypothetical protein B0H13DRAFT_2364557 [Mycena leptocephala]|nr:hypothetical protein B0H13DRAFT_2364557 [Mycena leptocephala]